MNDTANEGKQENAYRREMADIPSNKKLKGMSYLMLATELTSCDKDSVKFHVVEREMKKRLAKDQSRINRKNIILSTCIGGLFTLVGVAIGAFLKACSF